MSGGVDSSVAALLLQQQGFEVAGITMQVTDGADSALDDARQVADHLGIRHHVVDFRSTFQETIIDYFCNEYRSGRTPNPCVRCNRLIKFGALQREVEKNGGAYLATGHYARIEEEGGSGRFLLKRGLDVRKDQTYFLHALSQEQLRKTLMPLGHLTKKQVRSLAADSKLTVAAKRESQDVCFVQGSDYSDLIRRLVPEAAVPGRIKDTRGTVLGEHRGLGFYTVGQRKGLGIAAPEPLYVVRINAVDNELIVGARQGVYRDSLVAVDVHFSALENLEEPLPVMAQIRYQHRAAPAVVTPLEGREVQVTFGQPQMAVAPGQAVVLYSLDGETVMGGGTILT